MRLIDADALKEKSYRDEFAIDVVTVEDIDNAPTVEPEKAKEGELVKAYTKGFDAGVETARPQGEWIVDENNDFSIFKKCSNCGEGAEWLDGGSQFLSNYCPACGADMRKEKKNEHL